MRACACALDITDRYATALAAQQHSVPFVVLVGLHKLSPLFPHDPDLAYNGGLAANTNLLTFALAWSTRVSEICIFGMRCATATNHCHFTDISPTLPLHDYAGSCLVQTSSRPPTSSTTTYSPRPSRTRTQVWAGRAQARPPPSRPPRPSRQRRSMAEARRRQTALPTHHRVVIQRPAGAPSSKPRPAAVVCCLKPAGHSCTSLARPLTTSRRTSSACS